MPAPEGTPLPDPSADLQPYPNDALILGASLFLEMDGSVVTETRSIPVDLNSQTLKYWERVALNRQGVPLQDLIV